MRHPLHPALVHFPIACWSLATASDIASLWCGKPAWQLAGVLLVAGTLTAIAAMATGFLELTKLGANDPATRTVNRHMVVVMAAWSLYAASLFLRLRGTTLTQPGAAALALGIAGFACLCVAGWLGGTLVYRHGVGVETGPRVTPRKQTHRGR